MIHHHHVADAGDSVRMLRRQIAQRSVRIGRQGEDVVHLRLTLLGVLQVCKIETGWRIKRNGGKIVGASPMAKVAGDYRGILPGGRSVLVESKAHMGKAHNLRWSDLDDHQVRNLNEHHTHGGLSLLAYSFPGGITIMLWPVPFFAQGTSIDPDHARVLNLTRIPKG